MSLVRRAAYAAGMMIRETGQAMDRAGARLQGKYAFVEQLSRHRQIMNLQDSKPIIASDVFLAPSASVIGNVELHASSSVWYGAVVRGDTGPITIGERASIQDRAVVHAASRVGAAATISSGAVIESAAVGPNSVIGPSAVIAKGAVVGSASIVAPGSYVAPGTQIADGELWSGAPATRERALTAEEQEEMKQISADTANLASAHAIETGKTHEQIEAEKLRQELLEERSEDYNSHLGLIGREAEIVEIQARIVEEDQRLQRQAGSA